MTTEEKHETRSHEHVLEIDSTPEAVWNAIATPEGLASWFPPKARVEPGVGGTLTYEWSPDTVGVCRIEAWDAPRHLRTTWPFVTEGQPDALAVDWFIEGKAGATVLRLVHSGFGPDDGWDSDYQGTRRGWMFELCALKVYLESHVGKQRRSFWVRHATELEPADVWRRFTSPGDFMREGNVDGVAVGETYRITLADGQVLEGEVRLAAAPMQWSGTVKGYGDGLLLFGFDNCGAGPEAIIMLKTWGLAAAEVEDLEERYRGLLSKAFA